MKTFSASESTQAISPPRALDPGLQEELLVGGVSLEPGDARGDRPLEALRVAVDHDKAHAGRLEVARHLPSHAAEPADQVVL